MNAPMYPRSAREVDARRKALAAARAVSLALLAGVVPGCAASVTPQLNDGLATNDAGTAPVDTFRPPTDTGPADTGVADAMEMCTRGPDYLACCERVNWNWESGCQAWGPLAPPEMHAIEMGARA